MKLEVEAGYAGGGRAGALARKASLTNINLVYPRKGPTRLGRTWRVLHRLPVIEPQKNSPTKPDVNIFLPMFLRHLIASCLSHFPYGGLIDPDFLHDRAIGPLWISSQCFRGPLRLHGAMSFDGSFNGGKDRVALGSHGKAGTATAGAAAISASRMARSDVPFDMRTSPG
jgi:hypothetical protein